MTVYTLDQIKDAWQEYRTKKVMKVSYSGKWYIQPLGTGLLDSAVNPQVVTYKDVLSFPKFLEKHYG